MYKILFTLSILALAINAQAQQLINPGFESWSNGLPVGWGSIDQLATSLSGINPGVDTLTTDKHSGNYAILLSNKYVPVFGGSIPGLISTGPVVIGSTGDLAVYGQPYTLKPISYDFYFKYLPHANDTAFTIALITRWNTSFNKRDTLAITNGFIFIPASATYYHATVPFYWLINTVTPDSITIVFSSSTDFGNAPLGSQLFVDDVHLNVTVGVDEMSGGEFTTTAYPNPSSDFITISTADERASQVMIFDLAGRLISTHSLQNKSTRIDLSFFENGFYLFSLTDEHNMVLTNSKFNVAK